MHSGTDRDANGNLTADGQYAYLYDIENRLVEMRARVGSACPAPFTGQIKAKLRYDPLGRLYEVEGFIGGVTQGVTRFLYDGDALVAEYNGSGIMLRRHVHGPLPGADDPILSDEGSALDCSGTRVLHADARGSIVAQANCWGTRTAVNTYDEYGIPGAGNTGRFQYTGQIWLPELGMYYYKARFYSPTLGRFLQTDPIGYEDNINLYAYVANDPINGVDPTGLQEEEPEEETEEETTEEEPIVVTGAKIVGSIVVPGWDLGACAIGGCSDADWGWAVVDLVPVVGKVLSKGRKGYKAVTAVRRACGCVVAGTLVSTPEGLVAIETLRAGDMVLAYDVATGEVLPQPVLDVIETEPKRTYNVVLRAASGETARFEATDDHPWLNATKEWRNTEELVVGDWLIAGDGERFEVVEANLTGDVEVAYTLTVDTLHTYIMGEAGLVVHNAKCPKIQDLKKAGSDRRDSAASWI